MKTLTLAAAAVTLSLTALSAAAPSARAQDKPVVVPSASTGKPVMVVPAMASSTDTWKAMWAYRNVDAREVNRYHAEGFSDDEIKGAANIAMRTGGEVEYYLRLIREVGIPLATLASDSGLSTDQIRADIPGYGVDTISVMTSPPTPASAPMIRTGMINSMTDSTVGTTSSASLPAPIPPATTAPAVTTNSLVDVILGNPDFSTLASVVKAGDMTEMLQGPGPYTIFAPTNAAFAKLPAGTLDDWMKPENKEKLRSVLQYHVLPGKIMAADIMAMSNPSMPRSAAGSTLNVKTTAPLMVNDANVTATDIVASNGVIHVVDTVLMPPATDTTAAPATPAAPPAAP